jgi:hypothetical protein
VAPADCAGEETTQEIVTLRLVATMMVVMAMSAAFAKPSSNASLQAKQNYCEDTYTDNAGQQAKCLDREF